MNEDMVRRLLGLVHSGQFFHHRTLATMDAVMAQLSAQQSVPLAALDLVGVRRLAFEILRDEFRWIQRTEGVAECYRLSDAGLRAFEQIAETRQENAAAFRNCVLDLLREFQPEGVPRPAVSHDQLVEVLTAESVIAESNPYDKGWTDPKVPSVREGRKVMRGLHSPELLSWAREYYTRLRALPAGSDHSTKAAQLRKYGQYVAIIRNLVGWQERFGEPTGEVWVLLDPSILVALVCPGDQWHPLVRSVVGRLARLSDAGASAGGIRVSLKVPDCSIAEFYEAAERAWDDYEALPVRSATSLMSGGVKRLGLVDYFRRLGVGIGEAAVGRLDDDLYRMLSGHRAETLEGIDVDRASLDTMLSSMQGRRRDIRLTDAQLLCRLELYELAERSMQQIPEGGYSFVITTSSVFLNVERRELAHGRRPHVVPGLMMFCLAEALGVNEDTIAELEAFAVDYIQGEGAGLQAWQDIREYWESIQHQPAAVDYAESLRHLWTSDMQVLELLKAYLRQVLGAGPEELSEV